MGCGVTVSRCSAIGDQAILCSHPISITFAYALSIPEPNIVSVSVAVRDALPSGFADSDSVADDLGFSHRLSPAISA